MIERPTAEQNAPYTPIPSNLGSFLNDVTASRVVDEQPAPEEPTDAQPENPTDAPDGGGMSWEDDPDAEPGKHRASKFSGDMLARLVDRTMANTFAYIAHGEIEDYEASDREMDEIREGFTNWMAETGVNISPTVALIMSLSGIYALRLPQVFRDRQRNLKNKKNVTVEDVTADPD